uniref:Uncharacterized protein n=1 Tax=Rhizophagus irregularis (strain DAOM 181602 / DAOM 197198 / MUCL 43194) TaxID=747089 RepID=U9TS80_RHIID
MSNHMTTLLRHILKNIQGYDVGEHRAHCSLSVVVGTGLVLHLIRSKGLPWLWP